MNNNWLVKNTFHYSVFNDLKRLVEEKVKKNLKISLCLPTLNEEKTIAKEIIILKSELMTRCGLLDEIVVIDSGSTDDDTDAPNPEGDPGCGCGQTGPTEAGLFSVLALVFLLLGRRRKRHARE